MACVDENTLTAYFAFQLPPRETEQLFKHVDTCGNCARLFHDVAAAMTTDASQHDTLPAKRNIKSTPMLGRYRIDRMLGMGGMGVVYGGYDPELDRKVAIKLLQPDSQVSAGTLRARLVREAQAMAQLSHPNVINVFEVGTFHEQVFVVMELIEGVTLAAWLRAEHRDWRAIVRAFVAAGDGLAAAHKAGIIHRDFKPDNVLVGNDGRICVTDFGLARRVDTVDETAAVANASPIDMTLTRSGLLLGTPAYMAPEQMRGEETDERTNLFSFCVALYEALFDTRPFAGKNLDELRTAIEGQRLTPPKRLLGPRAHKKAIERGLCAKPADRPRSLNDLLAVLRKDPAARRRRAIAAAALLLTVAAALGVTWRSARRARLCTVPEDKLARIWDAPRHQAIEAVFSKAKLPAMWRLTSTFLDQYARDLVAMQTSACEATRVRGEQSDEILDLRMQCLDARLRELRVLSDALAAADRPLMARADLAAHALSSVADCADAESLRSGARLPADPSLRVQIAAQQDELSRAGVLHSADKYAAARDLATTIAEHPVAKAYPRLRAGALLLRGRVGEHDDRFDDAIGDLKEAARIALEEREWRIVQHSWSTIGSIRGTQHKLAEALEWFALSAAAAPKGASDQYQIARAAMIAQVYTENDQPALAEQPAREALALAERQVPVDQRLIAQIINVLAASVRDQGRLAEAIPLFERAITTYRSLGEEESFIAAAAFANLGSSYYELHRYPDAESAMRRSLEILQRIMTGSTFAGYQFLNLANVLCKEGRYKEAAVALDQLEPILARHKDMKDTPAQLLWLRGEIALGDGRARDAMRLLERALAEETLSEDQRFEPQYALARALEALGRDHARARELVSQARAHALHSHPPDSITADELARWLVDHH